MMDDLITDFLAEAEPAIERIDHDLAALAAGGAGDEALPRAAHALHNLKGAAGFLKLPRLQTLAHACEDALLRWKEGRAPIDAPVRARAAVARISELLAALAAEGAEPIGEDRALVETLAGHGADWAVELAQIRDRLLARANSVLSPLARRRADVGPPEPMALAPVEGAWKNLPAMVAELSAALGKPMKLLTEGGDVQIAAIALAPLSEALGHLVRNAADHGVERPAERRALRKPKNATIMISASGDEQSLTIRVSDDGRGLDAARIRHAAISRGMLFASHAARMTADQLYPFVFEFGLSTSAAVTFQSGRGIGLDAVRERLGSLGGSVTVQSDPGQGAAFILTAPLRPSVTRAPDLPAAAPAIAEVA